MTENLNQNVTRADLNQQLEVHKKTIELQMELSQQQQQILDKLSKFNVACQEHSRILEMLERRTWKQGWLYWGMIFSLVSSVGALLTKA
jgi:phage gp16-like protein|tara:strand:+ start:89 stop:355 length:267 start_codon:yes stop_codon:yes gene_type:complete